MLTSWYHYTAIAVITKRHPQFSHIVKVPLPYVHLSTFDGPLILPHSVDVHSAWSRITIHHVAFDVLDQWCLRTPLGIKWHQFVCNDEMRRITKQPNLPVIIQSRRLPYLGTLHIWMMTQML